VTGSRHRQPRRILYSLNMRVMSAIAKFVLGGMSYIIPTLGDADSSS
jgi:hypothetical protein